MKFGGKKNKQQIFTLKKDLVLETEIPTPGPFVYIKSDYLLLDAIFYRWGPIYDISLKKRGM